MNLYLSYDHADDDFVYLKAGLFPDSWLADLILLVSEVDEWGLLDLPAEVPDFIAQGTTIRNLAGGTYTTEEDLYLAFIEDMALADTVYDPLSWLEDAVCDNPVVAYSRVPLDDESFAWPTLRDPNTQAPNITEHPHWYVPEGIDTATIVVASRKSTYPFWTHTSFTYWTAYPGTYTCEGLPYAIHVTCFPYELSNFLNSSPYNEQDYWGVDGYYRNIQSNASTWHGFDLDYVDNGSTQVLQGQAYRPEDTDDPAIWYNLGNPEEPVYGTVILPILVAVALLAELIGLDLGPLSLFKLLGADLLSQGNLEQQYYLGPRMEQPMAMDSEPFAMDAEPFAA